MSIRAMHWGWAQSLPPTQKLVLMAICDIADDDGLAWPSIRTIAKKCCVGTRTAQRVLRKLEQDGYLARSSRTTLAGRTTSNAYQLALAREGVKLTPSPPQSRRESDTSGRGRVSAVTPSGVTPMSPPEPPKEQSKEPARARAKVSSPAAARTCMSAEDQRAVAAALRDLAPEEQQRVVGELAEGMRSGSIREPTRWVDAAVSRIAGQRGPVA
ncbi:helix-turn-helix domain-containing protein [Algiphilus sp.]|jgi:hypothetical protein|uniref:helix-turn-helix domain-containing protein n=1 Tax=Algiphilus sp. TaxID=1872431 RepID=UPI0034540DC5|nr:helix-turn-helix domain-containing protein [Algiphilus sp.]